MAANDNMLWDCCDDDDEEEDGEEEDDDDDDAGVDDMPMPLGDNPRPIGRIFIFFAWCNVKTRTTSWADLGS